MALFASIALVLSVLGIYGVLSNVVSQRTREIGIRMALGAGRREILAVVTRYAARLIAIGLIIALPQWVVLRKHVDGAWWWLYANGLAYTAAVSGLAIALHDAPIKGTRMIVAAIGGGSLAMGLIVAVINGIFLIGLLRAVRNRGERPCDHDLYFAAMRRQVARLAIQRRTA